jgi:hypothetical protein
MPEISGSGLSAADVLALIAVNANNAYVASPSTPMTVANLIANFPPGATYLNQYARVSDLYGSVDDIMRCRFDGTNYRWVPQRESFAGTSAATTGAVNIIPLVTPPVVRMTATLVGNVQYSATATNAYVGQRQVIINNATISIFVTMITGLIGSNLTILGGSSQTIVYGPTGWYAAN